MVEVGAGNGLNFKHYPAEVTEVVAVEPEPYLLEKARERTGEARAPVRLEQGDAYALPLADGEADAVVFSLVLCTIPDADRALREAHRVLRPGGEVRFYEHVVSRKPLFRGAQRGFSPVWRKLGGGCNIHRDTVGAIERAGFSIDALRRFAFKPALLAAPHVIGTARKG